MGMSMHLSFFRSPDDPDMQKKLDAAYMCAEAGVGVSPELHAFVAPVLTKLGELPANREQAVDALLGMGMSYNEAQDRYGWKEDMCEGFEIDLTKLPEGVSKVRFWCSW